MEGHGGFRRPHGPLLRSRAEGIHGKESYILFVPSGTMANQLAIKAHTQPGDEVILEASAHPYNFEGGAGAVLSGVQFLALQQNLWVKKGQFKPAG